MLRIVDGPLTPERVARFWRWLSERYGTAVVRKRGSPLMQAAAVGLTVVRVQGRAEFLDRFTTVVGRRIYAPFEVGDAATLPLERQVVIAVHEHQHVEQWCRDGGASMSVRYLLSARARARYEAEAYTCNLELAWLRHGAMPEPATLAARLERYGCGERAIAAAQQLLEANAERIRAGEIVTAATRTALEWSDG